MKIVIAGSSGFVGQRLVADLERHGHTVLRLVRYTTEGTGEAAEWAPSRGVLDISILEGADAVINLAGANIAGRRWTEGYKEELRLSRVGSTALLAKTMASMNEPPKVLINASAVGFYGDRGEQVLDETSAPGGGFLADLTSRWEEATAPAVDAGIRVVLLRLGMVIGNGGALNRMLLPFKFGMGGPIGNGRQWWPWIAIDDVVGIVAFALQQQTISGPINVVSPEETTSRDFAKTLCRILHRPSFLPAPAFAVRLLAGEMADALLLSSARVRPDVLERFGYQFEVPSLNQAISRAI